MQIKFSCQFCKKSHTVDASLAGRKGRCKGCGTVMQIPTSSEAKVVKPAATNTSRTVPTSKTKPRTMPLPPVLTNPSADEVDDPYGFADEPASAPPITTRREMLADEAGDSPLPHGKPSRPSQPKRMAKRGVDEGPWGVPIRNGAIALMGIVLIAGRIMKYVRRAHQEEAVGSYLSDGILALCLLAALLSIMSVIGAAVSFSRGNRSAFRGESNGGQMAWVLSVLASLVVAYFFSTGFFGFSWGRLAALDASLSNKEQAPLSIYEDMIVSLIQYHQRLAGVLDTIGNPQASPELNAFMEMNMLQMEAQMLESRSRAIPPPTREQVRELFAKFSGPYREALAKAAQSGRDALGRLPVDPNSPPGKSMKEASATATEYEAAYRRAYPEGSTDATGWYFALFSRDAGSAGRGLVPEPAPAPHDERSPAPPPTTDAARPPGPTPSEVP